MPQNSGNQRAARNFPLHPAVFEKSAEPRIFGNGCSMEQNAQAAADSLMETSPADFERRPFACFEANGCSWLFGLPEKVERIAGLVQRHVPIDYSVPRVFRCAGDGMREYLHVDEALPAGVYSADSLSSADAPSRR